MSATTPTSTDRLLREHDTAVLSAWARLLRGHAATSRALSAQLLSEHGLALSDYEALLLLARAERGALRRVDLAEGLALTPSGVTRLLDGLERQGLVEKGVCAEDARVTYAVLTDAGRAKLERASCSHVRGIRAVFEQRFSPAELETLAELLGRLPGAGGADGADCTAG
jgi:DNA-binding MarR family transcriptional regulator